jgi:D-alanine-D-alanine ligase
MYIAILTGWISTEREVALRSGANMRDYCERAGHTSEVFDLPTDLDTFLSKYKTYDFVIPVFHGRYGEDGVITGMCESIGIKVAMSPSHVHALCIDKYRTNCVVEKIGVKIPRSWIPGIPVPPKLLPVNWNQILEKSLIVKPNQWGSSLATAKVKTHEEFERAIQAVDTVIQSLTAERMKLLSSQKDTLFVRHFPSLADMPIVQECIEWREFTVWVYRDTIWTHVLPIIEIMTIKHAFFDYEEKYESDGSNEVFTDIEPPLQKELEETSARIYDFLGCRGIVRIDYRYDGKDLYFLEVNTIPGFTAVSLVPKMWKKAGKTEKEFVEMLLW